MWGGGEKPSAEKGKPRGAIEKGKKEGRRKVWGKTKNEGGGEDKTWRETIRTHRPIEKSA